MLASVLKKKTECLCGNDNKFMDQQTQKNLLDLVRQNYQEIADDFDLTRKKYLWPELVKLAGMIKDGDRVLDAGCGNGRLAGAFIDKNIYYLGIDSSEKLIEAADKNFQFSNKIQNTKCKFQVADVLELDKIQENNFNYIFCIAVLHHLPGNELRLKALGQMKRKLKPGGKIIITVWNLWSRAKFRKLIIKYSWLKLVNKNTMDFGDILFDWKNNKGEKISSRYYHIFTKNNLKKLVAAAGFKLERIYKDKYNYYLIIENKI